MSNSINAFVGERVRDLRLIRGIGQDELGRLAGITAEQVQGIEEGRVRACATLLFDLAAALEVPVSQLFQDLDLTDEAKDALADHLSYSDLVRALEMGFEFRTLTSSQQRFMRSFLFGPRDARDGEPRGRP